MIIILASSGQDCGMSICSGILSEWALVTLTTGEGTLSEMGHGHHLPIEL